MSKQSEGHTKDNSPGPAIAGGCDPCSVGRRNRYYRDKRLHVADYVLEQQYHIARRRLVNRAMLGWGVAQGFYVDAKALTVGPGVALDPWGRELVACEAVNLAEGGNLLWLGESKRGEGLSVVDAPDEPEAEGGRNENRSPQLYLLSAHYAEKRVDGVRIEDDCGDARCEANQVCETVVYSLRPIPCCIAGLPECRCPECAGEDARPCGAGEPGRNDNDEPGYRRDEQREGENDSRRQESSTGAGDAGPDEACFTLDRGNHRQLALWSLDPLAGFDPCRPDCLHEAGCVALDPDAGVPLACVTIGFHCGEPRVAEVIDGGHPRRLARPNEVLFDLIRGCDLTRIKDVGWRDWLPPAARRQVPYRTFVGMFEAPGDSAGQAYSRRRRITGSIMTGFTVEFTGPVRTDMLTPDVIAISLIQREPREDVGDFVRVPIVELSPRAGEADDPPGTTRGFAVLVDRGFWEGEINPYDVSGFDHPTLVEIEIRTDWILDCNGQEVAGGGRFVPSTGSVPGGRFLSSFTVVPDEQREAGDAAERDTTAGGLT